MAALHRKGSSIRICSVPTNALIALNSRLVGNRRSCVEHRYCRGFDVTGLVAATRVSLPLTNTFMEFSVSPDSSVYS
jgi:hypothetical protein